MRKGVFEAILFWLRKVGRYTLSNWLLIIVFSCLAAYLIFPAPLDHLAFILWPVEKGPRAQITYTVSGAIIYPGTVNLNITITNNDVIAHDYAILALMGSNTYGAWWGPGYYRDDLAPATDIQNITNPWYSQAFITTGSLNPGQFFQVTRKIQIDDDPRIKDAVVVVFDKHDVSTELARNLKLNVINSMG
jgi:hypothetical protein